MEMTITESHMKKNMETITVKNHMEETMEVKWKLWIYRHDIEMYTRIQYEVECGPYGGAPITIRVPI